MTRFEDRIRFNWGYWDGCDDVAAGRMALWALTAAQPHPFDRVYGDAYWIGQADHSQAKTSDKAWSSYNDH